MSALIAEGLSGSTPPARFFLNPVVFAYLTLYYGSAALLVRELTYRWGKGWPTLLLLGATWAIVQEGLGTKVFFDPTRTELSPLVNYGTLGGVHWAFVTQLLVYHAVYSIVLPILLTSVLYWSDLDRPWAPTPILWLCAVLQVGMTFVAYQTISTYKPPAWLYALTLVVTGVLLGIARLAPGGPRQTTPGCPLRDPPPAYWFFGLGLVGSACFFFVSLVLPGWIDAPLLVIGLMIIISAAALWAIHVKSDRGRGWSRLDQLALASGLLAPLILMAPVQEARGLTGESIVAIATAVLLFWMARHVGARHASPVPHA
jgi:hypothetical protein